MNDVSDKFNQNNIALEKDVTAPQSPSETNQPNI